MMKKRIQKLPDSELDVMIALWNGHQEMTRSEIEEFMNHKKKLAPTSGKEEFCFCKEGGKSEPLQCACHSGGISAAGRETCIGKAV